MPISQERLHQILSYVIFLVNLLLNSQSIYMQSLHLLSPDPCSEDWRGCQKIKTIELLLSLLDLMDDMTNWFKNSQLLTCKNQKKIRRYDWNQETAGWPLTALHQNLTTRHLSTATYFFTNVNGYVSTLHNEFIKTSYTSSLRNFKRAVFMFELLTVLNMEYNL